MKEIYFYGMGVAYLAIIFTQYYFQRHTRKLHEASRQVAFDFGAACGAGAVKCHPAFTPEQIVAEARVIREMGSDKYLVLQESKRRGAFHVF